MAREAKLSNIALGIEERVNEICEQFSDFMYGTRIVLVLQRKKEGGNTREERRRHMSFVTHNEAQLREAIQCGIEHITLSPEPLRLYMTACPRDVRNASYEFKKNMLQADHEGGEHTEAFYQYMQDRWISALMKHKVKDSGLFIIDVDDIDGVDNMAGALRMLSSVGADEVLRYRTKGGWHIVTKPFNRQLWTYPQAEVKIDSQLLLAY